MNTNTNTNTNTTNTVIPLFKEEAKFIAYVDGKPVVVNSANKNVVIVCLHDGEGHADDILSFALLQRFLPVEDVRYIRSRRQEDWDRADLVVDVGEGLLDHHGCRCDGTSAAVTRVWELLDNSGLLNELNTYSKQELKKIVDWVAAADNGDLTNGNYFPEVRDYANYGVAIGDDETAFRRAFHAMWMRLDALIETFEKKGYAINNALVDLGKDREDERIVVFDHDTRLADVKRILYDTLDSCIYYISPIDNGAQWRILCAAPQDEEFSLTASKRLIPEKFRALRDEALNKATGLSDGVFSHAQGFIAGFKSRESAVAFAKMCLD